MEHDLLWNPLADIKSLHQFQQIQQIHKAMEYNLNQENLFTKEQTQ